MKGDIAVIFIDDAHRDFYNTKTADRKADCYLASLIYTLGLCGETRRNFDSIYDVGERTIKPEVITAGWQTGTTSKVTRLAFQLFTDGTPTAFSSDEHDQRTEDISECQRYSVSDIFCCEFAPYFVEAIKIRYPEYFAQK